MWLPREWWHPGPSIVSHPRVQSHPCSGPYPDWVCTWPLIFFQTYYTLGTVLGVRDVQMKEPQTQRMRGPATCPGKSHTLQRHFSSLPSQSKGGSTTRWPSKEQDSLPALYHALHARRRRKTSCPFIPVAPCSEWASVCASEAALGPSGCFPSGQPWLSPSPGLEPNRRMGFAASGLLPSAHLLWRIQKPPMRHPTELGQEPDPSFL